MTCNTASCRQLAVGVILLATLGMAVSVPLRGMQPTTKKNNQTIAGKLADNVMAHERRSSHLVGKENHTTRGNLEYGDSDNVMVYGPRSSQLVGSLILLMGYHGDLAWTLTQWWYLHAAWSYKDQEWCHSTCTFNDEDKAAVRHLTNKMRIVDAVGNILLDDGIGHAWYDYTHWPDGPPIVKELDIAVANVFALIEREYKVVGDYNRIAIAGMSQGADLALEVGMQFPHQLGMVVSERGVIHPTRFPKRLAAGPGTPFILLAGDSDELTPPSAYKASCASLQQMQTPTYLKLFQGVNHGGFSKEEWVLLIKAFGLMLNAEPTAKTVANLDWWTSCSP